MDHSSTMRTCYERINSGDIDGFGALLADDFVEHETQPDLAPTKEGVLAFFRTLQSAFPDMTMDVRDVIASGEKSVARVVVTGTHRGEFMGVPPTGHRVEVQVIDIMRFDEVGLVCEHWGLMDALSMMQQLGVVPVGPPG